MRREGTWMCRACSIWVGVPPGAGRVFSACRMGSRQASGRAAIGSPLRLRRPCSARARGGMDTGWRSARVIGPPSCSARVKVPFNNPAAGLGLPRPEGREPASAVATTNREPAEPCSEAGLEIAVGLPSAGPDPSRMPAPLLLPARPGVKGARLGDGEPGASGSKLTSPGLGAWVWRRACQRS